jgi:hypothetical protein
MTIFGDILRFFGVVLGVLPDNTKAFSENLEMAERYVRWGDERHDVRDYLAAAKHCENCRDEDTPKVDLLLRKYSTLYSALLGIMRVNVEKFRTASKKARQELANMRSEIDGTRKGLNAARTTVDRLEADGNMIKAKEELRHVEEIERHLARLEDDLKEQNPLKELGVEYRRTYDEHMQRRTRLELSFAALLQAEDIAPEMKENVIAAAKSQLGSIEADLTSLAPEGEPTPKPMGPTPVPAEPAGDEAAGPAAP